MIDGSYLEHKACSVYYGSGCQSQNSRMSVGTISVDDYVLNSLMPDLVGHDRQPSAFIVYLALWRLTHGSGNGAIQIALQDIAECTGLAKRSVQDALRWLSKRKLVSISRASITSVPVYTVLRPWKR
jgi:hypothetical protein